MVWHPAAPMRWGWCAHIIHGLLLISIIATSANGCPFLRRCHLVLFVLPSSEVLGRSPVSQDAYKTATSRELLAATEIPATKYTKLEQATVDSVYEEIIALVIVTAAAAASQVEASSIIGRE